MNSTSPPGDTLPRHICEISGYSFNVACYVRQAALTTSYIRLRSRTRAARRARVHAAS